MAQALRSIAGEGWVPLAAAMVGTIGKKPMWADLRLRPVVGTTVDIKISPQPLAHRELDLLLSCWRRWDHDQAIVATKGGNSPHTFEPRMSTCVM